MQKETYFFNLYNKDLLGDKTSNDLDIPSLFNVLDESKSAIGCQYLYYVLRNPEFDRAKLEEREDLVSIIEGNRKLHDKLDMVLSKYKKSIHYMVPKILFENNNLDFKLMKYAKYSIPLMLLFVSLFKVSWIFLCVGIFLAFFNCTIHFVNKLRIQYLIDLLKSHYSFNTLVKALNKLENVSLEPVDVSKSKIFDKIVYILASKDFSQRKMFTSEFYILLELVTEFISSILCIEYFMLEIYYKKLDLNKSAILKNFKKIGELDLALTIIQLRNGGQVCIPRLSENTYDYEAIDMCHPLIPGCVPNSFSTNESNMVITGSNMSGKTSFVRAIALNQLMAQTIHCCFAKEYYAPFSNIYTIINIQDDLLDGISYFKRELDEFKEVIDKGMESCRPNLIVIDEPLKGTNALYSTAISYSVIHQLGKMGKDKLFITTHSFQLADMLAGLDGFEEYHFEESINGKDLSFDYKIKKGKTVQYNPIKLLENNGFHKEISELAQNVYSGLKGNAYA